MGARGRRGSDEHREYEDMAVAHVVGGLTLDEGRLFRSHLLECTACRARVGELRAIAHDLADVERDERRERAAKRTDTKERADDEAATLAPAPPRFRGRTTLVLGFGLVLLMALSSWNFMLRSRLEHAESVVALQRRAVTVLQDGTPWRTLPSSGAEGQVVTLDRDMVVMVHGLTGTTYGIYLLNAEGRAIHRAQVTATNGTLFEFVDDAVVLPSAEQLLVVRSDQLLPDPRGGAGPTVYSAERVTSDDGAVPEADQGEQLEPVGETGD
jgi:hypothetical protein